MPRFFLEIEYDGAPYNGWQVQPGAPTVQQTLQDGIALLLRAPVAITGAGRTDTGVHATMQFAHFDWPHEPLPGRFFHSLNGLLPPSIAIRRVYRAVPDSLHARYSARLRGYVYHIAYQKSPFTYGRAWWLRYPLDTAALQAAAPHLLGTHAFDCFCKAGGDQNTTLCTVSRAEWQLHPHGLSFHIEANRFLRGMVRAVVGTLVEVGRGLRTPDSVAQLMADGQRPQAGPAAPPHGLYLCKVTYPEGSLVKVF